MRMPRLIYRVGIVCLSGFLAACNPVSSERGGEPATGREAQAEFVRLQDFADLLHKEIDQLHRDKERLAEVVEQLKRENAALASAATRCKAGPIPTAGSKGGDRAR